MAAQALCSSWERLVVCRLGGGFEFLLEYGPRTVVSCGKHQECRRLLLFEGRAFQVLDFFGVSDSCYIEAPSDWDRIYALDYRSDFEWPCDSWERSLYFLLYWFAECSFANIERICWVWVWLSRLVFVVSGNPHHRRTLRVSNWTSSRSSLILVPGHIDMAGT